MNNLFPGLSLNVLKNGIDFTDIGTVMTDTSVSGIKYYNFSDADPKPGNNFLQAKDY